MNVLGVKIKKYIIGIVLISGRGPSGRLPDTWSIKQLSAVMVCLTLLCFGCQMGWIRNSSAEHQLEFAKVQGHPQKSICLFFFL